jgi:hypothetical protein
MQASKCALSSTVGQGKCKGSIAPDVCGASVDGRSSSQLDDVSLKEGSKDSYTELAGDGTRPQGRGNAVNQKDSFNQGGRNHLDAEIRVSNALTLYFKISFARSYKLRAFLS